MRDFVLLTAVCIAIVLGVGWFLLPGAPADLFRSRVTVASEASHHPDAAPATNPHAAPKVRHDVPAGIASRIAEETQFARISSAAPSRDANSIPVTGSLVSRGLPLPWDVLPGEPGAEVLETYGAPQLSTSTQEDGHLFETYVYRSSGTQATVHLEDGRVSRVSLKGSPQAPKP